MDNTLHKPLARGKLPHRVVQDRVQDLKADHDCLVGSNTKEISDTVQGSPRNRNGGLLQTENEGSPRSRDRIFPRPGRGGSPLSMLEENIQDSPRRKRRLDATASLSLSNGPMNRNYSVKRRQNVDESTDFLSDSCISPWGQNFSIGKRPITSEREFIRWLISDIQNTMETDGNRNKNRFFSIVLGGNVHIVKTVLEHLKQRQMKQELDWILGMDTTSTASACCSNFRRLVNGLMFLLWFILFLVLTPIFYTFHVIAFNAHLATRGSMSHTINLPMVFAVLSEEADMIKVFMQYDCQLDGHDEDGNNIYHYLADLSHDQPEKAVRCHYIICECVQNLDVLRTLIMEQTNQMNITALEAIAKYGSMHFLRIIMLDRSCIGNLRLSVSKESLWADVPEHTFDINSSGDTKHKEGDGYCSDATLNVLEFDISRYEKGDIFGRQSYLLQLVGSRSVESMKEIDIWALIQSKLIEKWTGDKFKKYLAACVFGHILYVVVSILFLEYVVDHGGDMNPQPLLDQYHQHDTELYLEAAVSQLEDTCLTWDITWDEKYLKVFHDNGLYPDNCSAAALSIVNKACGLLDPEDLYRKIRGGSDDDSNNLHITLPAYIFIVILLGQVILDAIIRLGFLCYNFNFRAKKLVNTFLPVLVRRFPGSYTEKHLSSLMYISCSILMTFVYILYTDLRDQAMKYHELNAFLWNNGSRFGNYQNKTKELADSLRDQLAQVDRTTSITGNLMIICLMIRFLHTIHSLRLLPGVGFFVITTKKMAKHLLQFTIVFVFVSLAFATIFHFVMRRESCAALKIEGFESLTTSLFSTYQVSLGYGEYDFTHNLNARIAYIAYTITTTLLLLNLIIAVMTTTAEELNQMPWKQALCRLEQWDEILGTEVTARTLLAPLRRLRRCIKTCTTGPAWTDIRHSERKTFEVTFLK